MDKILDAIGVAAVRIVQLEAEVERLRSLVVLDEIKKPATQDDIARVLVQFDGSALYKLYEDAINLFLEYRDQHGYEDEDLAKANAVNDLVEGVYAITTIDKFFPPDQA